MVTGAAKKEELQKIIILTASSPIFSYFLFITLQILILWPVLFSLGRTKHNININNDININNNINVNVNVLLLLILQVSTQKILYDIWELGTDTGTVIKFLTKNLCWENIIRLTWFYCPIASKTF